MVRLTVGLDLGRQSDPSALAVLSSEPMLDEAGNPVRDTLGRQARRHDVVHLVRYPLGTAYPAIVEAVSTLLDRPEIKAIDILPTLILDETGVGAAVADLFADRKRPGRFVSAMITAGSTWRTEPRPGGSRLYVAKSLLCSTTHMLLETRRLRIGPSPLAPLLQQEFLNFQVKITAAANETYGAWREGTHDDLVFSVALAAWHAESQPIEPPVILLGGRRAGYYDARPPRTLPPGLYR